MPILMKIAFNVKAVYNLNAFDLQLTDNRMACKSKPPRLDNNRRIKFEKKCSGTLQ